MFTKEMVDEKLETLLTLSKAREGVPDLTPVFEEYDLPAELLERMAWNQASAGAALSEAIGVKEAMAPMFVSAFILGYAVGREQGSIG